MNRRYALFALSSSAIVFSARSAFAVQGPGFDKATFEAAQAAGKSILLHVAATWCETCEAQRVVIEKLEKDPAFKDLLVLVIDFDKQKDVMRSFGVSQRSTLIAFKGKTEMGRMTGNTTLPVIKAVMTKAL